MVIPSEIERHQGEVWDPKDGLLEIEYSNKVIQSFISDMNGKKVPSITIAEIVKATDILGLYAGYPSEAASMESYIKTDEVLSYREVMLVLEGFSFNMNALIDKRLAHDRSATLDINKEDKNVDAEFYDVPF